MAARDAFRQALIDGDVRRLRRIWASQNSHLPQELDAEQAENCMHIARTATSSIPLKLRAYSHRWLTERNLPSQLPDKLRPEAERMYPQIVESVGFSWGTSVEALKPLTPLIQKAVTIRIEELIANGDNRPEFVRKDIVETKNRELKRLIGVVDPKETLK